MKYRVTELLGLENPRATGKWLAFWAGTHDIGKATPSFQKKCPEVIPLLKGVGLDVRPIPGKDPPHGTMSTHVLLKLLSQGEHRWSNVEGKFARRLAITVGGHHGLFPASKDWGDGEFGPDLLGGSRWDRARSRLLDYLASTIGVVGLPAPQPPPNDCHWFFMVLAGLTSVADWIGSNPRFFKLAGNNVNLKSYPAQARAAANRALDELGWTGWEPSHTRPASFVELFPWCDPPRPMQDASVRVAERLHGPALVLIEAPMGEGKTEAALYFADRWIHAQRQQGLYVALPTMATSNQMFGRIVEFLRRRYPDDRVNLHLLHSGAMLSEQYSQLQREAEVRRQSFRPDLIHDDMGPDHTPEFGVVVAESWFAQNKKQAMLAPFGVGTIDQALLAVLQTKHVFVRLFGLSGKTVVLDEVHAYDTYMSAILDRLLEWLNALGCSVVLLSATLPKARRQALLRSWTGGEPLKEEVAYPRLSVVDDRGISAVHVQSTGDRYTTITLRCQSHGRLADDLAAALRGGGCAAVIRNTIAKAQQIFQDLRGALRPQQVEVELFHARFPLSDRQRIEQRVLDRFGKGPDGGPENPRRPTRTVLVATQVIEQSLDLDFDLMVSDVAPVDLVLQRAGRLHRHPRKRPEALSTPRLWLLEPDSDCDGVPCFQSDEQIYDRHVLLRSYLALRNRTAVRLPDDIEGLIEAVYGDDPAAWITPPNQAWQRALEHSQREMEEKRRSDQHKACGVLIESPHFEDDLQEQFNQQLEEDNPEVHATLRAATRLVEPSVSVVLLHETADGGVSITPDGAEPIDISRTPDLAEARRLLGRSVTLQHRGCVAFFCSEPAHRAWRESSLLRFHRPALLDAQGRCKIGKYWLLLDLELGVVIESASVEGCRAPWA